MNNKMNNKMDITKNNKMKNEINFIIKLKDLLIGQIENHNKFSLFEKSKSKKIVERLINNELDYLFENPEEYFELYISDED